MHQTSAWQHNHLPTRFISTYRSRMHQTLGWQHKHLTTRCVLTYNKVIISCSTHQTSAWQRKHLSRRCVSTFNKVIISCRKHQTSAWQHKHLSLRCISTHNKVIISCRMLQRSAWQHKHLTFSSKLDWASYMISIAKTVSKKVGALIPSMKFLSPEVVLYHHNFIIRPCMKYCCHVQAGAPSFYLELSDKLQKRIWRTVGHSLATSLEPLAHRRNVASLSLFYRCYFGRCSSELAQLVPLPFPRWRSVHNSDRLHDFSVTIPKRQKDFHFNNFFPRTARLGILCLQNAFL